jgi:hypothetical protein
MTCPTCGSDYDEEPHSDDQRRKFHAMCTDLAKQVPWHGQKLPAGVWKRLLIAAWLREEGERPMMVPALDGVGVDVIYEKSSKLGKRRYNSLITWADAFGAEYKVEWSDPEFQSQMREYAR